MAQSLFHRLNLTIKTMDKSPVITRIKEKDLLEHVEKRDGCLDKFDIKKIEKVIIRALQATNRSIDGANVLVSCVNKELEQLYGNVVSPKVEQIQDVVERVLMDQGYPETAKAYILYRQQQGVFRKNQNRFYDPVELVDQYLTEMDWRVKENANMGYSLQGLNNYVCSNITSLYWLNKIYDQEIGKAHNSGALHVHDLGLLSTYCCGWDLPDLLEHGFGGVGNKINSSPPKHFATALGQIVNFIYTLQGEASGAQAFSSFDTYLAPFIYYDELTYEEVKQEMQQFLYNLNIPTRVGFQTPFSNITLDVQPHEVIGKEPVIIGGEYKDKTYSEFQKEMIMLNRAFCEIMMEGDATGRGFGFPIPTYNITKDFDWENPEYDAIWKITSKYGTPYFANFCNSDMRPDQVRSMCCRLRLDNTELQKRGGGLFGANPLTGSIGVVTINLPRLAYETKDEDKYFKRIDELLKIARRSLKIKREVLEDMTEKGLYPYTKHYLRKVKQARGAYWANHFNTIGVLGMNEACLNMYGYGMNIASEDGRELGKKTLDYIREQLVDFQQEDDQMYNLEATPGEGTSPRFAQIDKIKYPDILQASEEVPYYTNSTNLPVGFTGDMFEALEHQDDLLQLYTGGSVFHTFIGERIDDPDICKELIKKIANNFKLPYFSITPTYSICPNHGYLAGEHKRCPICS